MTLESFCHLAIDGLDLDLRVRAVETRERLHELPQIDVTFEPFEGGMMRAALDVDALLGKTARVTLASEAAESVLTGEVDAVRLHATGATIAIAHPAAVLSATVDHRVLVERDAVSIAKDVFAEHGVSVTERIASTPAPRPQCVQAFEADLAFCTRLLADEGIALLADATTGEVTFCEGSGGFQPIDGGEALGWGGGEASGLATAEVVFDTRLRERLAPTCVQLRDYWFEKPELDLRVEAGEGPLSHYAFCGASAAVGGTAARGVPSAAGASRYHDAGAGRELAQKRLASLRREAVVLEARTTSPRIAVGRTFRLEGAPRDDLHRTWVVISLARHLAERREANQPRYVADFVAVPADDGYRPRPAAPASMGGISTANITGPSGQEIAPDEHGRVTARLRYDRRGTSDDRSSTPARVLQPPTTGGFFLPRVGWDALVAFTGPSGDEPFVLGRLDNGAAPPAEALPGNKARSAFGTPTTPGGGSGNMVRIDDGAGAEEMTVVASSNYDEQTAINKKTSIKGSEVRTVGANRDLSVDANRGLEVDGAQLVSVGANRRQTAGGGVVIGSASETISVGGTRDFTVGGDETTLVAGGLTRTVGGAKNTIALANNNRHVDAASHIAVGGAWGETGSMSAVSVVGLSNLESSAIAIKAVKYGLQASALAETVGSRIEKAATIALDVGGALALSFGATAIDGPTVHIKAGSIKITGGGGVLSVSNGSVSFTGAFKAGGHVRSKSKATHG